MIIRVQLVRIVLQARDVRGCFLSCHTAFAWRPVLTWTA